MQLNTNIHPSNSTMYLSDLRLGHRIPSEVTNKRNISNITIILGYY